MSEIPTSTLNTGRNLNVHKTFSRRFWTSSEPLCTSNLYPVSRGAIRLLTLEKPQYKWYIHLNRKYKNMVKAKIKKTRGSKFSKFTRKTLKQQHVLGIASFICFYYQANLRVLTNFYYPWYHRKHLWLSDDFRGIEINKFLDIRLILEKNWRSTLRLALFESYWFYRTTHRLPEKFLDNFSNKWISIIWDSRIFYSKQYKNVPYSKFICYGKVRCKRN